MFSAATHVPAAMDAFTLKTASYTSMALGFCMTISAQGSPVLCSCPQATRGQERAGESKLLVSYRAFASFLRVAVRRYITYQDNKSALYMTGFDSSLMPS